MQYSIKFIRNGIKCVLFSKWITFFSMRFFFWSNKLIQFEIKAFADTLHFTDANFFFVLLDPHINESPFFFRVLSEWKTNGND